MSQQIKYAIAGFCMGLAELIPGVSGSTIAVVFKIYKNFTEKVKFSVTFQSTFCLVFSFCLFILVCLPPICLR